MVLLTEVVNKSSSGLDGLTEGGASVKLDKPYPGIHTFRLGQEALALSNVKNLARRDVDNYYELFGPGEVKTPTGKVWGAILYNVYKSVP